MRFIKDLSQETISLSAIQREKKQGLRPSDIGEIEKYTKKFFGLFFYK